MRPIPPKHTEQMNKDPYYKYCIINDGCSGKVDRHHSLIYKNRQINEMYAYRPLCKKHHSEKECKLLAEYLSIRSGLEDLTLNYPRFKWSQRLSFLKTKFGAVVTNY